VKSRLSSRRRRGNGGVTLVELMVVVAIVAILAVAFLAAFRSARANAIDGRAVDFLDQTRRAMALYHARYGRYPVPTGITIDAPNSGAGAFQALATALRTVESDFPTSLTEEPVNLQDFVYFPAAGGDPTSADRFTIVARAINGTGSLLCADPARLVNLGGAVDAGVPGSSCTGGGGAE
jgi:prepilin-type N-terminal cleavage/methylation domain-containing protein